MITFFNNRLRAKSGLRHVVYQHFLKSAVMPLCSLIGLMLLLYFGGTYYTYQVSLAEMRERAKSTVNEIARSEARSLNQKLQEVARNTAYLQTVAERLFQDDRVAQVNIAELKLNRAKSGIFYRDMNTMMDGATIYGSSLPSSLYVSAETKMTEALKRRLFMTDALDLHFQRTVDSNPNIHSAYFSSWDHTKRTYPPVVNAPDIYDSGQQAALFKNDYLADEKNNPGRTIVWTDVYPDAQSGNWMLSSITPVYHHGFMEGVIGVNIMLDEFTASLLSTSLIWGSAPLITDNNGNALGLSPEAKKLLNISTLLTEGYTQVDSINPAAENNLFQHAVFNNSGIGLASFVNGANQAACCAWINKQEYLISQQTIKETGWRLVALTPLNNVTQQVTRYQRFINNLGVYFVLLTSIFFILFFVYLKKQASRLAIRVSNPVEVVTEYISRLNKLGNNKPLPVMQVGIRELDRLIDSSTEIQRARSRLSLLNMELAQKNDQLQTLATTDRLTGLYNRHKLDEIMSAEMEKARRYDNHFTIALLDIDHFKRVNDTYGHQVGDSILIGVSAILRRRIRGTDIVGRWGGEEFIVLLPNTSLQQAACVLNALREQLSRSNFEPVEALTVSLGLASSAAYPGEDLIIAAADEALYRAKSNGRNRLEITYGQTQEEAVFTEAAVF